MQFISVNISIRLIKTVLHKKTRLLICKKKMKTDVVGNSRGGNAFLKCWKVQKKYKIENRKLVENPTQLVEKKHQGKTYTVEISV